jgi:hypothetical protein
MMRWNALILPTVLLSLGACAENVNRPQESAQMILLRVIAASSENACTHLVRVSNIKTDDMTAGTVVFLSVSEASRTYKAYKKRCFKMIDEELKRLGLDENSQKNKMVGPVVFD